tara:strand:- start:564 stop:1532 length:969 start_codon:yes stop_codon:yes gene_type:complete
MSSNPIIIIGGEPQSIFLEIFLKAIKKLKRQKKPIILISSKDILKKNIKKFNNNIKINELDNNYSNLKLKSINLVNIDYKNFSFSNRKITSRSNLYLNNSFIKAIDILKKKNCSGLINGPISKKYFLKGKFNGITEFLAKKTNSKNPVMLIYNKNLSVSPLTTHMPISKVSKDVKKTDIINKIKKINDFYLKVLNKKPRIAVTGLNPHCESFDNENKEKKEIIPAIKYLKKRKINARGPYAADTIFLKENFKKFDLIFGMYHDQVLGPMKTLFGFNAINITLGLPFIRISPDHGPNVKMLGKNKSNPNSIIESIRFIEKHAV